MRGFKFSQEPEYERTGFKEFKCQECKQKVQISGKKLMVNPPRWITRGQCKSEGCISHKLWITTRVEPATLLVHCHYCLTPGRINCGCFEKGDEE